MSLRKARRQLPAPPSLQLTTIDGQTRAKKVSNSNTSSETPSPTFSTNDSSIVEGRRRQSIDLSTSVSDPDDYVAGDSSSAPQKDSSLLSNSLGSVSAALTAQTMRSKGAGASTATQAASPNARGEPSSSSPAATTNPGENRRASGRFRRPTVKAQEMNNSPRAQTSPGSEISVTRTSAVPDDRSREDQSPSIPPSSRRVSLDETVPSPELPKTPKAAKAAKRVNGSAKAVKGEVNEADQDETSILPVESPSRRVSHRERKPTAKALSDGSPATLKRPAPEAEEEQQRPRKSARTSHSAAVPSKLRYSLSSTQEDPEHKSDPAPEHEAPAQAQVEIPDTPQKSLIVVLKSKRLSEINIPGQSPASLSKLRPRPVKEKPKPKRKVRISQPAPVNNVSLPMGSDPQAACRLFCLPPSSRLLAFAEIARQMPDTDDEGDEDPVPGSAQDWRMYTQHWCQCGQIPPPKTDRTNSAELERALLPNTVSNGTQHEPVDLTGSATPEAELLSAPVNTILRASDAERLSQLFSNPSPSSARNGVARTTTTTPATSSWRPGPSYSAPQRRASEQTPDLSRAGSESYFSSTVFAPNPVKRTYEDRLRDDHNALTNIRKRAAAKGISWSFNMTFDDIYAMLMDVEDQQQAQYAGRQATSPQYATPGPRYDGQAAQSGQRSDMQVDLAYDDSQEAPSSSSGFGMLLPPSRPYANGALDGRPRRRNRMSRADRRAARLGTNGQSSAAAPPPRSSVGSVGDDEQPVHPAIRRLSSPTRPKSSRFRVDPRGLRGESPGPGTIINIEERTNGNGNSNASGSGSGGDNKRRRISQGPMSERMSESTEPRRESVVDKADERNSKTRHGHPDGPHDKEENDQGKGKGKEKQTESRRSSRGLRTTNKRPSYYLPFEDDDYGFF